MGELTKEELEVLDQHMLVRTRVATKEEAAQKSPAGLLLIPRRPGWVLRFFEAMDAILRTKVGLDPGLRPFIVRPSLGPLCVAVVILFLIVSLLLLLVFIATIVGGVLIMGEGPGTGTI